MLSPREPEDSKEPPSGGPSHLWEQPGQDFQSTWKCGPEAQNVCSPSASQSPAGLVPKLDRGCVPWQDPGWLPGLEIRQAWVQSGGARPLGHFPRLFLEEDEDTQCRDPLPCQEVGGQPRACPWLPHEGHRLRGGRQDL